MCSSQLTALYKIKSKKFKFGGRIKKQMTKLNIRPFTENNLKPMEKKKNAFVFRRVGKSEGQKKLKQI